MKSLILLAAVNAVRIEGIDKGDLMQEQGPHWRKAWPQGLTDSGEHDHDVINIGGNGREKKLREVHKYVPREWTLDADVVDTQAHLGDAESMIGDQFSKKGYWDRGLAILNSGDRAIKSVYI